MRIDMYKDMCTDACVIVGRAVVTAAIATRKHKAENTVAMGMDMDTNMDMDMDVDATHACTHAHMHGLYTRLRSSGTSL